MRLDRSDPLVRVPLFERLDEDDRAALLAQMTEVRVPTGGILFDDGDPGDCAYLVRHGSIRVFLRDQAGGVLTLATLGPGELFGEVSLLDGGPRAAGAQAAEDTTLLMFDRDDLLEFFVRRPHAALGLLTVMGGRIRDANRKLRGGPAAGGPGAGTMGVRLAVPAFVVAPIALVAWGLLVREGVWPLALFVPLLGVQWYLLGRRG